MRVNEGFLRHYKAHPTRPTSYGKINFRIPDDAIPGEIRVLSVKGWVNAKTTHLKVSVGRTPERYKSKEPDILRRRIINCVKRNHAPHDGRWRVSDLQQQLGGVRAPELKTEIWRMEQDGLMEVFPSKRRDSLEFHLTPEMTAAKSEGTAAVCAVRMLTPDRQSQPLVITIDDYR